MNPETISALLHSLNTSRLLFTSSVSFLFHAFDFSIGSLWLLGLILKKNDFFPLPLKIWMILLTSMCFLLVSKVFFPSGCVSYCISLDGCLLVLFLDWGWMLNWVLYVYYCKSWIFQLMRCKFWLVCGCGIWLLETGKDSLHFVRSFTGILVSCFICEDEKHVI